MGMTTAQVAVPTTKVCETCKQTKSSGQFYTSRRGTLSKECRSCARSKKQSREVSTTVRDRVVAAIEADAANKSSQELVVAFWGAGMTSAEVASKVIGYTAEAVIETVARYRMSKLGPDTRELERQKALMRYERFIEQALERGDLKEARMNNTEILKAVGIIQQGGAAANFIFNQTNNVLETRLEDWMRRNENVSPDGTIALPAAPADTEP